MTVADTSRAAYRKQDLTAGQRRVLGAFRDGASLTRHEIAHRQDMPLQTVCGRVHELLHAGALRELPAVAGKHPLVLNSAQRDLAVKPAVEPITPPQAVDSLPTSAANEACASAPADGVVYGQTLPGASGPRGILVRDMVVLSKAERGAAAKKYAVANRAARR